MADKRMFSKQVIDSDAFLDMPLSTQCLYFHLAMRADDDGFVNNPRKVQRMICASDDDFRVLISKSFVLPFDSGVVVIRHWRIHNYLRSDRYQETAYKAEKACLVMDENGAYAMAGNQLSTTGIPNGNQLDTQDRIGKDKLSKDRLKNNRVFIEPTLEEVQAYCNERKNGINAQYFIDYYAKGGWILKNGRKMVDWKAAVRTWEQNDFTGGRNGKRAGLVGETESQYREFSNRI